jgi:hypothetical protein
MLREESVPKPERYRPSLPTPQAATDALLDLIGPVDDMHVLLIGPGGLDMMCDFIDQGCASVEMVSLGQRHRADFSEIVIVPNVSSAAFARDAIAQARRTMRPLNSLILRFTMDDAAPVVREARNLLMLNGFNGIRTYHLIDRTVLTAELPLCGRLANL